MGWITYGPRCIRPLASAALYADARQRVLASRRLRPYLEIILADCWNDNDHLRWVIKGKVQEIEAWARQIKEDSDG
jgi:hypothetical protein